MSVEGTFNAGQSGIKYKQDAYAIDPSQHHRAYRQVARNVPLAELPDLLDMLGIDTAAARAWEKEVTT